jgi:bifunctional non-homologous end joining protein LigD
LRAEAPRGDQWIHEIKLDGYRTQAHIVSGEISIYTRRGYNWTTAFASIAAALRALSLRDAILDGEVVVLDEEGHSDYHRLQEDLARRRTDRLSFFAFDLLYLDGKDLRRIPLLQRKSRLARLLQHNTSSRIRLSEHIELDGNAVFAQACRMQLEGIVCKLRDSRYQSGRTENWIKVKCRKSDSYPIVAFVEKLGARPRRIASLYLGRRENGALLYAGKARSGYTEPIARYVRERLDPFVRASSPLTVPVKKPKATWVEPVVDAEVQFSGITADGLLREAVFKGIREDLAPVAPPSRSPRRSRRRSSPKSLGVPAESILQLLPDAVVPPREELARYWRRVASRALEYLARRPLKLVRHVHGTTFYHMGPLPPVPSSVHQLKIHKRQGGEGTRLWVDDVAGLLGLVDIGTVELHPWNATVNDVEHPDQLVFDLDPGEGIDWDFVVASALLLRKLLRTEGHESWPKLSGGKGVHVMVPIEPKMTHDAARRYAKQLAQRLAADDPARYTLSAATSKRSGRLFIDYLRNGRGTTAVGTFSPRALAGFPVAVPVAWSDLTSGVRPDGFSIYEVSDRSKR